MIGMHFFLPWVHKINKSVPREEFAPWQVSFCGFGPSAYLVKMEVFIESDSYGFNIYISTCKIICMTWSVLVFPTLDNVIHLCF